MKNYKRKKEREEFEVWVNSAFFKTPSPVMSSGMDTVDLSFDEEKAEFVNRETEKMFNVFCYAFWKGLTKTPKLCPICGEGEEEIVVSKDEASGKVYTNKKCNFCECETLDSETMALNTKLRDSLVSGVSREFDIESLLLSVAQEASHASFVGCKTEADEIAVLTAVIDRVKGDLKNG